jgi:hypothetical protein
MARVVARKISRILAVPWTRNSGRGSDGTANRAMSTQAPSITNQTSVHGDDTSGSELDRLKRRLRELGLEEIEDDGWGYRAEDGGGGPVGHPVTPGPVVTVEDTGGVPQRVRIADR